MKALGTVWMLFLAVICSGLLAAVAFGAQLGLVSALTGDLAGSVFGLIAAAFAVPAFMLGAALGGVSTWLLLRRTKWNTPMSAAILGGSLTSVVGGLIFLVTSGGEAWPLMLPFPAAGAVGGCIFQHMMNERPRVPKSNSAK